MQDKIIQIAERYGEKSQILKLRSECCEAIEAIDKLLEAIDIVGYEDNHIIQYHEADVIQELADLSVLIPQVVHFISSPSKLSEWTAYKVERTLKRIEKEK